MVERFPLLFLPRSSDRALAGSRKSESLQNALAHKPHKMPIQIRHAKLVLSYVCVTLIVTSLCLGKQHRSGRPIQHSAAAQHAADVQHAAKFVLLNAVLGISAASLLFCSTGFALAGLLLFGQKEKRENEGLHYLDSPPVEAALARQRRETAAHTLTAANWAVALLWLAFAWSLDSLRWVLKQWGSGHIESCRAPCALQWPSLDRIHASRCQRRRGTALRRGVARSAGLACMLQARPCHAACSRSQRARGACPPDVCLALRLVSVCRRLGAPPVPPPPDL